MWDYYYREIRMDGVPCFGYFSAITPRFASSIVAPYRRLRIDRLIPTQRLVLLQSCTIREMKCRTLSAIYRVKVFNFPQCEFVCSNWELQREQHNFNTPTLIDFGWPKYASGRGRSRTLVIGFILGHHLWQFTTTNNKVQTVIVPLPVGRPLWPNYYSSLWPSIAVKLNGFRFERLCVLGRTHKFCQYAVAAR